MTAASLFPLTVRARNGYKVRSGEEGWLVSGKRNLWITVVVALSVLALVAVFVRATSGSEPRATPPRSAARATPSADPDEDGGRAGNPEVAEQSETTDERTEALREANEQGPWWGGAPIVRDPTAGWAGERRLDTRADDWEPSIAADPNAPYVYALVTRYGGATACPDDCPSPAIMLYRSVDGGRSWDAPRFLCPCEGQTRHQYDPIVRVVPDTGDVYALWMNEFHVVFSRSSDHGETWSAPVSTYGKVPWNDKPALATSADGQDVYVSWNGPSDGDPFISQSHDGGRTWVQHRLFRTQLYYFAFDGVVTADGTVVFAEVGITYDEGDVPNGAMRADAIISRDGGATWSRRRIAVTQAGILCSTASCRPDFYTGHVSVAADGAGGLAFFYDGADRSHGRQVIRVRTSPDGGLTWSDPQVVSVHGENATMPASVGGDESGDIRVWYDQTNGRPHRWNVWYRSSADGGLTWSAPARLSDVIGGVRYVDPRGFREIYGDYGGIAITDEGRTIGAWGEGFSYAGPGQVWVNRQS